MKSVLNMHFQAPSPLSKMCFEYQGIIFNEKKVLTFFTNAYNGQARGQPDRKISVFF